jgi:hypothetical protein
MRLGSHEGLLQHCHTLLPCLFFQFCTGARVVCLCSLVRPKMLLTISSAQRKSYETKNRQRAKEQCPNTTTHGIVTEQPWIHSLQFRVNLHQCPTCDVVATDITREFTATCV